MPVFYILIVPVLIICIFILFVLSRHDFAILRRNITLVQIFDKVFIAMIIGFVVGRFIYIFNSGQYYLLNFLAFFHLIRNSGFSIFGFFVGLVVASGLLFRKSKIMFRMLDVILLSFFPVAILSCADSVFLIKNMFINAGIIFFLLTIFFLLLRLNAKTKVRDGFIASILLGCVCVITIISNMKSSHTVLLFNASFSQIAVAILLSFVVLYSIYLQVLRKKK